jgi:hypothetical protein
MDENIFFSSSGIGALKLSSRFVTKFLFAVGAPLEQSWWSFGKDLLCRSLEIAESHPDLGSCTAFTQNVGLSSAYSRSEALQWK